MPFGDKEYVKDLNNTFNTNQVNTILVSNLGRYIFSDEEFKFTFNEKKLIIESNIDIEIEEGFKNLKGAFRAAAKMNFNLMDKIPDPIMFKAPQYNTWIEMGYNPTEEKVLEYAKDIIDNGFPPGVLMIDHCWNEDYGTW